MYRSCALKFYLKKKCFFFLGSEGEDSSSEAVAQRCFVRKGVLRNFAKFTGKHLCQSLFSNKVTGLPPVAASSSLSINIA